MSNNTYLKHLEELNQHLQSMTELELLALVDSVEVTEEETERYSVLEQFVVEATYNGSPLDCRCDYFLVPQNPLALAA